MSKRIVSGIWIYPVKSLGGVQLPFARVLPKGLAHDRRWMLIDPNSRSMTQRDYPKMALFKLSPIPAGFAIHYSDQILTLPFESEGKSKSALIWDDTVEVCEVSRQYSDWFSNILEIDCQLVSFPENNPRPLDPGFSIKNIQVSLADAYPMLILGQASLDDLNDRLETPLPMNRFRPNIIFTGGEAYEEDRWDHFRIGINRFATAGPCSRCALTTVNQETGDKGMEPLATLAKYRKQGKHVYFGQNLVPLDYSEIAHGDEIHLE